MATNFQGYLLKFGDTIFPNNFLSAKEYIITPKQRIELEAYRDDYTQDLYRTTAPGLKTKISFYIPYIWEEELIELHNYFAFGLEDELQRKYKITYWDMSIHNYDVGSFYLADPVYDIYRTTATSVQYKEFQQIFVEY